MDFSEQPSHTALSAPAEWRTRLFRPRRALYAAEELLKTFSPGDRFIFYVLSIVLAGSAFALLAGLNAMVSSEVPSRGGSLTEGIVGTPRFAKDRKSVV